MGVRTIVGVGVGVGFEASIMTCGLRTVKLAAAPPARMRKIIMPNIAARENLRFGFSGFVPSDTGTASDAGGDCCELTVAGLSAAVFSSTH